MSTSAKRWPFGRGRSRPKASCGPRCPIQLEDLLKDVGLDARERKFLWPDGRLDLDQSVRRINQQYPDFPEQKIKEFLIHWIQALYVPEGYSESQMNKFERLTAQWAEDLNPGEN
jgi:hypothetical protein